MYELLSIGAIAGLIILARYLHCIALQLGHKKYLQHLVFENLVATHRDANIPLYKKIISLYDAINFLFLVGMLFMINGEHEEFMVIAQIGIGFLSMTYVLLLGLSIAAIFVFRFVIQYPEQITGHVHFKAALVDVIARGAFIQILVPMVALVAMAPSYYGIGAIGAIILSLLVTFKNKPLF